MIYLDSSVALARVLAEIRTPPDSLWREVLVSSRLLEYEIWVHVQARGIGDSHEEMVSALLDEVELLEMTPHVLARAQAVSGARASA